eukprot:263967-Hanusia_phi.AAC.2
MLSRIWRRRSQRERQRNMEEDLDDVLRSHSVVEHPREVLRLPAEPRKLLGRADLTVMLYHCSSDPRARMKAFSTYCLAQVSLLLLHATAADLAADESISLLSVRHQVRQPMPQKATERDKGEGGKESSREK